MLSAALRAHLHEVSCFHRPRAKAPACRSYQQLSLLAVSAVLTSSVSSNKKLVQSNQSSASKQLMLKTLHLPVGGVFCPKLRFTWFPRQMFSMQKWYQTVERDPPMPSVSTRGLSTLGKKFPVQPKTIL